MKIGKQIIERASFTIVIRDNRKKKIKTKSFIFSNGNMTKEQLSNLIKDLLKNHYNQKKLNEGLNNK